MKRREIEKQIKKDLSVSSHSDFSKIMERCRSEEDAVGVLVPAVGGEVERKGSKLRYILWLFSILVLTCLIATVMLLDNKGDAPLGGTSGYFIIDINPSIKISYDENGLVTEVIALNEDAEVLLVGTTLTGKTSSEAVSLLFDKCVQLGYFSAERDNNAVLASATADSGERDEKMTSEIKTLFANEFSSKKIRGVVITSVQSSELEAGASEHGIDSQKYALILSYLDMGGELESDEYDDISISELYSKISDKEKEIKEQSIEATKKEQQAVSDDIFNTLFESVESLITKIKTCIEEIEENSVPEPERTHDPQELEGEKVQSKPQGGTPPHRPNDGQGASSGRPVGGLTDMIEDIHSVLGSSDKDDEFKSHYALFTNKLDEYISVLEDAEKSSDCERAVNGILDILSEMKKNEKNGELIALIDSSSDEIHSLYAEFLKKSAELSDLNASIEEKNSERLEAFKDASNGKSEDIEKWQRDKEHEISSSWYEMKKEWENDRKNDFKK